MLKANDPVVYPSSRPNYAIFRMMNNGWNLVRTNLNSLDIAEALFNQMKNADPHIKLRILEIKETVIRED